MLTLIVLACAAVSVGIVYAYGQLKDLNSHLK